MSQQKRILFQARSRRSGGCLLSWFSTISFPIYLCERCSSSGSVHRAHTPAEVAANLSPLLSVLSLHEGRPRLMLAKENTRVRGVDRLGGETVMAEKTRHTQKWSWSRALALACARVCAFVSKFNMLMRFYVHMLFSANPQKAT